MIDNYYSIFTPYIYLYLYFAILLAYQILQYLVKNINYFHNWDISIIIMWYFVILCDIFWMAKFLNSPFTFLEYVCICLHWIILENILPDQNLLTYATYSITSSTCSWSWSTSGRALRWWITSSIITITCTNFVWKSNHRKNIH